MIENKHHRLHELEAGLKAWVSDHSEKLATNEPSGCVG